MFWGQSHKRTRLVVGITSRSHEESYRWLEDFLRNEFRNHLEVKSLPITNNNKWIWEDNVRECSSVILYHTKNQGRVNMTDEEGALYDQELTYMERKLGRRKVLVLLDDMDDDGEDTRWRILRSQPTLGRLAAHLILIPRKGKMAAAGRKLAEFRETLSDGVETPQQKETFLSSLSSIIPNMIQPGSSSPKPKPVSLALQIGIFSRSADSNYAWLTNSLKDRLGSAHIRPVYITNNYAAFTSELQKCHFAILYHTQKQGRLNVTDVTDSLYDRELQDMSRSLGKQNVIVVIDDLKISTSEEKERILKMQPSILTFARDLFLFQEKEKNGHILEAIRGIIRMSFAKLQGHEDVPDAVRQHASHSDVQPSVRNVGPSVSGKKSTMIQSKVSARDPVSSYPASASCQISSLKSDHPGPQMKKSKTLDEKARSAEAPVNDSVNVKSFSEKASSMEGKRDLSGHTMQDLVYGIYKKNSDLEKEIQELRQANRSQEETNKDQGNRITSLTSENDTMRRENEEMKKIIWDLETARKREKSLEERKEREREKSLEEREERVKEREKRLEEREEREKEREKRLQEIEERVKESEKRLEERDERVKEREKSLEEREKREREREKSLEERVKEREKSLEEREEIIFLQERSVNQQEIEIREGEIVPEERELKKSTGEIKTLFPKKEEWRQEHKTQPQERRRFLDEEHHLKENLQKSEKMITQLTETIDEKDCKIQRLKEEILNYQYMLTECKCSNIRKVP